MATVKAEIYMQVTVFLNTRRSSTTTGALCHSKCHEQTPFWVLPSRGPTSRPLSAIQEGLTPQRLAHLSLRKISTQIRNNGDKTVFNE